MGIHGGRRWKRRRRRLHGASGGARLNGELQGEGAELPRVLGRRGETGGDGYGERRRPTRSGGRERENQGRGRNERVGERCGASRGVVRSIQSDEGRTGRQGGRRWRGAAVRVRRARAVPLSGRKTT